VEHPSQTQPGDHTLIQQAVLELLLAAYPAQLSLEELVRELATDPDAFIDQDEIRNAVRDLAGNGLLHRNHNFLFPRAPPSPPPN